MRQFHKYGFLGHQDVCVYKQWEKIAESKYQFGEIDLFCEDFKCSVVIKKKPNLMSVESQEY